MADASQKPDPRGSDPEIAVTQEQDLLAAEELAVRPRWRLRRAAIVTAVFFGLFLLIVSLVHVDGIVTAAIVVLFIPYIVTLLIAARPPRPKRKRKGLLARVGWQGRMIAAILVFLLIYLPFTFVSNKVIPLAPLVEYILFAVAIFVLYRLIARSLGVASSLEALPPPSHRTHRQVVGAIDDPHYQKTVVLNYNFLERGKGAKSLTGRLERILLVAGVPPTERQTVLAPLEPYMGGIFDFFGGRRGARQRERRQVALRTTFDRFTRSMEAHS